MLSAFFVVAAEDEKINTLIKYNVISKEDELHSFISRGRCVDIICNAIGVTDKIKNAAKYGSYKRPNFSDVDLLTKYSGSMFFAAVRHIGLGEGVYKNGIAPNFYPKRLTTYEEAVAFIMRCIEPYNPDINKTNQRALELDLVNNKFLEKRKCNIPLSDLCDLLYHLINQLCYTDMEDWQSKKYVDILEYNIKRNVDVTR